MLRAEVIVCSACHWLTIAWRCLPGRKSETDMRAFVCLPRAEDFVCIVLGTFACTPHTIDRFYYCRRGLWMPRCEENKWFWFDGRCQCQHNISTGSKVHYCPFCYLTGNTCVRTPLKIRCACIESNPLHTSSLSLPIEASQIKKFVWTANRSKGITLT